MDLSKKSIPFALIFTILSSIAFTIVTPGFGLFPFSAFLIIFYYQHTLIKSLWCSFFIGIIVDLFSNSFPFGTHSISFSVITLLLYPQQKHFFADNISTLFLMTFLFSFSMTLFDVIALYGNESKLQFSFEWFLTDFIYMPFFDGFYGFIIFVLPNILFGKRQKTGRDYFLYSKK